MRIIFDFSLLSKPYRLRRCSYQMMHMCLIAQQLGHEVLAIVSDEYLEQHKFISKISQMWVKKKRDYPRTDIYIAKADAFYKDENWDEISKICAFKVCLNNSDKLFRESSAPYRSHIGHPVQDRADLYMPVNHSDGLSHLGTVIPAAHPIDPRMFNLLDRLGLYQAYLNDDVNVIREAFYEAETGVAGFIGARFPAPTRIGVVREFPVWAQFKWTTAYPSREYIKWMMCYRGCIDLRGNGDKSIRFTEAAMLGRTLLCKRFVSQYQPALINGHNCILVDNWSELPQVYDKDLWLRLAANATADYLRGWSMRAQVKTIFERAGQ